MIELQDIADRVNRVIGKTIDDSEELGQIEHELREAAKVVRELAQRCLDAEMELVKKDRSIAIGGEQYERIYRKYEAAEQRAFTAEGKLSAAMTAREIEQGRGAVDGKAIERAVLADRSRPCLYGVAGPCQHPSCLEAHYKTLYGEACRRMGKGDE